MEEDNKGPILILAVEPGKTVHLPESFFHADGAFFSLLANPPYLRQLGWNLQTRDFPRLRAGEAWEVRNGERKLLRLHSDGTFIVSGSIDERFLGWNREGADFRQIHILALIEYTYEFVNAYRTILEIMHENGITVESCRFKVGIRNIAKIKPRKLIVYPFEMGTWGFATGSDEFQLGEDFLAEKIELLSDGIYDSAYVAHDLVSAILRHFGVASNRVPYSKEDKDGKRYIDIERIATL